MDNEKYRSQDWQENKLKELYYAFGTSEEEGLKLFLNLVFELRYNNPSFLEKVYNTIDEIKQEAIYEITEKTLEWVKFWRSYNQSDNEKNPIQLERLKQLRDINYLSSENLGRLYFQCGFIENELKNHEKAAINYEESIRLLPDWSWAYGNLGNRYANIDRYDEAIAAYQKVIELDPKDALAYSNLGIVYSDLGRKDEAIAAYQKAIELDPKYAAPNNGLGYLYLIEGKLKQAKEQFQIALSKDADLYWSLINLGITCLQLRETKKAQANFRLSLEKCPLNSVFGSLNKVSALLGLERKEEALELLQQTRDQFNIQPAEKEACFKDWNLLATSPEPPAGIHEFIEQAKEILA